EPASARALDRAPVAVDRCDRLLKVARGTQWFCSEFDPPNIRVQVYAQDLCWITGGKEHGLLHGHSASVTQHDVGSFRPHPFRPASVKDPADCPSRTI